MNSVNLTATLTRDPELKRRDETTVCDMRVAELNGGGPPVFIDVSVFGAQADACAEHLGKGRQVAISGRLRFGEWVGKDGGRRSEHSIVAHRIDFLSGGPRSERGQSEAESAQSEASTEE